MNRLEEETEGKEKEVKQKENRRVDTTGGNNQEKNEGGEDNGVEGGSQASPRTANQFAGEVEEGQETNGLQIVGT